MTTKKIGISISKVGENSVGLTLNYLEYAARYGEPVLLLPDSSFRSDLDLLLLTGGPDCDPARFGEVPGYYTQKPDIYKEYFDRVMLPQYIEAGVPTLGICRGAQSLAIHFDSKLIQHMNHETNKPEDPYKNVHNIKLNIVDFWNFPEFAPKKVNFSIFETVYGVNSRHHQTIARQTMPECLYVLATHEKDGTVELFSHNTLPILGIQSHIEDSIDYNTIILLDNMVNKMIATRKSILINE